MSTISITNAAELLRTKVLGIYADTVEKQTYLQSKFPTNKKDVTDSYFVSTFIKGGNRDIAPQVKRGDKGKLRQGQSYTGNTYKPPFYKFGVNIAETDVYNHYWLGRNSVDISAISDLASYVGEGLSDIDKGIERAKTLQISQVLKNSKITNDFGDDITFTRGTSSDTTPALAWTIPAGRKWTTTGNAKLTLQAQLSLLVKTGMCGGGEMFDVVVGSTAWAAFQKDVANDKLSVVDNGLVRFDSTTGENRNGMTILGYAKIGTFLVRFIAYEEWYTSTSNVATQFINASDVHIFASSFVGKTAIAGVPRLFDTYNAAEKQLMRSLAPTRLGTMPYIEKENSDSMVIGLKCAPLAVPFSVNKIASMYGVA